MSTLVDVLNHFAIEVSADETVDVLMHAFLEPLLVDLLLGELIVE